MAQGTEPRASDLASKLLIPATAADVASILFSLDCSPIRIRIGGYPACGKTTLSRKIIDRSKRALHVESESWILPLVDRKTRDLSGAHPESYDIPRAVNDLHSLINARPVYLPTYSHKLGSHDGGQMVEMLPNWDLVLDGTPFTLCEFDDFSTLCLFLVPASFEDWLTQAIQRDVETRFFTRAEATRHNMRKARDLELVWVRSPRALSVKCHLSPPEYYYEAKS